MFQSRDHVKKIVGFKNTKHSNMRFTFEIDDQKIFSSLEI